MIDERKVKIFKLIGLGGGIVLLLLLMFFWQSGHKNSSNENNNQIASRQVTEFLKAYFNKEIQGRF